MLERLLRCYREGEPHRAELYADAHHLAERLGRALDLCKQCFQLYRANQYAHYCHVTCHPRQTTPLAAVAEGEISTRVFDHMPTLREILERLQAAGEDQ